MTKEERKMSKKVLGFLLTIVMIISISIPVFAGGYYPVFINGVQSELKGDTNEGITTIGLRALSEALGFKVDFKDSKILINSVNDNNLKITTLAENKNESHKNLNSEFGFSVLIENGDDKILFDTAKAGEFIKNAKKLNVDLSDCDSMILSHAHYDHCGGVMDYFDTYGTKDKTLYVKDSFFNFANSKYYYDAVGQKFDFTDGTKGYFPVGIDFTEKDLLVMIEYMNTNSIKVANGVTIYGNFDKNENDSLAPNMLDKNEKGEYIVDTFDEEIAVAVETNKGLVIVSGCSHSGILNIVDTIEKRTGEKVYAVIGGFHLLDASEEKIQSIIDRFKSLGIEKIGLSHCTGPKATSMFLDQMPGQTFINETGSVYVVE